MNNSQIIEWMIGHTGKVVVVFEPSIRDMRERWMLFMDKADEIGVIYKASVTNVTVSLRNDSKVIFTLPFPEKVMGLDSYRTIFIDNTGKMPMHMMHKYTHLLR